MICILFIIQAQFQHGTERLKRDRNDARRILRRATQDSIKCQDGLKRIRREAELLLARNPTNIDAVQVILSLLIQEYGVDGTDSNFSFSTPSRPGPGIEEPMTSRSDMVPQASRTDGSSVEIPPSEISSISPNESEEPNCQERAAVGNQLSELSYSQTQDSQKKTRLQSNESQHNYPNEQYPSSRPRSNPIPKPTEQNIGPKRGMTSGLRKDDEEGSEIHQGIAQCSSEQTANIQRSTAIKIPESAQPSNTDTSFQQDDASIPPNDEPTNAPFAVHIQQGDDSTRQSIRRQSTAAELEQQVEHFRQGIEAACRAYYVHRITVLQAIAIIESQAASEDIPVSMFMPRFPHIL